jgi:two-component system CheB/CheR fusion protein
VVFEPAAQAGAHAAQPGSTDLEAELEATRDHLRSLIESSHAARDGQAAFDAQERVIEELEISREELQSSQEELRLVNEELESRSEELWRLNDDVLSLLNTLEAALILVDGEQRLRRWTPLAAEYMGIAQGDVGRTLSDIDPGLSVPLVSSAVRGHAAPGESRLRSRAGRLLTLRVKPCGDDEGRHGALLMLTAAEAGDQAGRFAQALIAGLPQPVALLDENLALVGANGAWHEAFGTSRNHASGERLDKTLRSESLTDALRLALKRNTELRSLSVNADSPRTGRMRLCISAYSVERPVNGSPLIVLSIDAIHAIDQARGEFLRRPGGHPSLHPDSGGLPPH